MELATYIRRLFFSDASGFLDCGPCSESPEQLDPQQRANVFKHLDDARAGDAISEMEDEYQADVIDDLDEKRASRLLEDMDPDDAATS